MHSGEHPGMISDKKPAAQGHNQDLTLTSHMQCHSYCTTTQVMICIHFRFAQVMAGKRSKPANRQNTYQQDAGSNLADCQSGGARQLLHHSIHTQRP